MLIALTMVGIMTGISTTDCPTVAARAGRRLKPNAIMTPSTVARTATQHATSSEKISEDLHAADSPKELYHRTDQLSGGKLNDC